jgi:hypothetical protein
VNDGIREGTRRGGRQRTTKWMDDVDRCCMKEKQRERERLERWDGMTGHSFWLCRFTLAYSLLWDAGKRVCNGKVRPNTLSDRDFFRSGWDGSVGAQYWRDEFSFN